MKGVIDWKNSKYKVLRMPLQQRRRIYKCGNNFKTTDDIVDWGAYVRSDEAKTTLASYFDGKYSHKNDDKTQTDKSVACEDTEKMVAACAGESEADEKQFPKNDFLNSKISLFAGDITHLEVDAIVNVTNEDFYYLYCTGGIQRSIHSAASLVLNAECQEFGTCDTGDAKITGGYQLPAKYVIHAIGPKGEQPDLLRNCYKRSMDLLKEHKLETIAFPCISTGSRGYPKENAANVALETIRNWLDEDEYGANVKRVIFCIYLVCDIDIYYKLMPKYFPFE